LLQKFENPHYLQYSPIALGIAFIGGSLIGSILLAYKSLDISILLYILFVFLLVGAGLQLTSNRVVYIRIYQMAITVMLVAVYLVGATLFLGDGRANRETWSVATMLIIIAGGRGVLAFFRTRRLYTPTMPHGPLGMLNPRTGVVDPTKSPPKLQKQMDDYANKTNLLWRITPLIAGLSLAFVRRLSDSGEELVMTIITIIVVVGVSGSIGSIYAYILAILSWEKKHKKRIIVDRSNWRG